MEKALKLGIFSIPLAFAFNDLVLSFDTMKDASMEPAIGKNDVVLVRRKLDLQPGNVYVYDSPEEPNETVVKRLVAHASTSTSYARGNILQKGLCWLEGDRRGGRVDSRNYGPIPIGLLRGEVVAILWPLSRFGKISSENS